MTTPADLETYVAVSRLVHRYADAVVHHDGDQWASCWAEDSVWDLGGGRLVEGREAIVALWHAAMGHMTAVFQIAHNGDVFLGDTPDRATGRWYITERLHRDDDTRGILLAHYDDAYVRVGGQWRFARRFLEAHYAGPPDLSADFANTAEGLAQRRTR